MNNRHSTFGIKILLLNLLACSSCLADLLPGNLALPSSQQPGPLFSFGQNILDKSDLITAQTLIATQGKNQSYTAFTSDLFYGISDSTSVFFRVPVALNFKQNHNQSSGIQDILVQLEHAYYQYEDKEKNCAFTATIVGDITFPTGSPTRQPTLTNKTVSFFLGATASYVDTYWYTFASQGVVLIPPHNKTKMGSQFLYEFGLGHNLGNNDNLIILALLELNGIYSNTDEHLGRTHFSSKGNIIFFGPVLSVTSEHCYIQAGFQPVVYQKQENRRDNLSYRGGLYIAWKL